MTRLALAALAVPAVILLAACGSTALPGATDSAAAPAPTAQPDGTAAPALASPSSSPTHTAVVYLDNKYLDGYSAGKSGWKPGEQRFKKLCRAAGPGDGPRWINGCEAGMRAAAVAYVKPAPVVTHTTAPPVQPAQPAGCHPLSDEGTCYEPGEFCRDSDHGATGVAGDGKAIKCEDNDGWRWEPI